MPRESDDAVEVQVLADDGSGYPRCLVMPGGPSTDVQSKGLPVKDAHQAPAIDNDEGTARTEVSTEIDEMSLREKLSFGSLYMTDTFSSQASSFDNSRITLSPSRQGGLLSIAESNDGAKNDHQSGECPGKSLLDLDDDEDDSSRNGTKTTIENNVLNEKQIDFFGADGSKFTSPGSITRDTLCSENRAGFYSGYVPTTHASVNSFGGDALQNSDSQAEFYGCNVRSKSPRFPVGTFDTDSQIEFCKVRWSDTGEPLSCYQKIDQPAFSCDEGFLERVRERERGQKREEKMKAEMEHGGEDRSDSIITAMTCCFMPPQP